MEGVVEKENMGCSRWERAWIFGRQAKASGVKGVCRKSLVPSSLVLAWSEMEVLS
jgi:hypothetical protein